MFAYDGVVAGRLRACHRIARLRALPQHADEHRPKSLVRASRCTDMERYPRISTVRLTRCALETTEWVDLAAERLISPLGSSQASPTSAQLLQVRG
jgi:hypothetical protein